MSNCINLVMAQINPTVGDILANVELISQTVKQAKSEHDSHIVVFPELALTGYPPKDLLLREDLYPKVTKFLNVLCKTLQSIDVVVVIGYPFKDENGNCFNRLAWIEKGEIKFNYDKQFLPNYGVFDERRYFKSADKTCVVTYRGINFGLLICEDIWVAEPPYNAVKHGADILITLNASPFSEEKHQDRIELVKRRVEELKCPIIYVNQVGGQDELVFDGGSFAVCSKGVIQVQSPEFKIALTNVKLVKQSKSKLSILSGSKSKLLNENAMLYEAITLGIRDYVNKNGFKSIILGLSGGIDSALTLALAVDALGKDKVEAVMMPFRYTAKMSIQDAKKQAEILGISYEELPIGDIYKTIETTLEDRFMGMPSDVTEENLQARIRGILLMAISNKTGSLVLATSNKSEVAVGYSTLYGDMVGGFAPIKDLLKTKVYKLAKYRNSLGKVIPERVIDREPSAELKEEQKDNDSLPDYNILDSIIQAYVEENKTFEQIIQLGYEKSTVLEVINLINNSEYKRQQSAIGIRLTKLSFGLERRYPITNGYVV